MKRGIIRLNDSSDTINFPRRAVAGRNVGDPGGRQVLGSPFMGGRPYGRTPGSETYNMGVITYKFPSSKGN
jgi:hypothetical protein